MTMLALQFESLDKILFVTPSTRIVTSGSLFQNSFILRRPRVANFTSIINIATIFIKTTFKNSKKCQKYKKLCIKMQSISVFLDKTKISDSR